VPSHSRDLPLLSISDWSWDLVRSEIVTKLRRDLSSYARSHYSWDHIAQTALEQMQSTLAPSSRPSRILSRCSC
jgi:hypothetical protein